MSLSLLRPRVIAHVRDSAAVLLDPADYDAVLRDALSRYSRARPLVIVADLSASGTYDLPLPADWAPGWSALRAVEYPAGERQPSYVDALDYTIYRGPTGSVLRMLRDTPSGPVRVTYTGEHGLTETTTTVPAADLPILVYRAAALACEQLASYYSSSTDSTIQADSVDHRSQAGEYALRAKRLMQLADALLPVREEGEVRPAGAQTSWGEQLPAPPLTHAHR